MSQYRPPLIYIPGYGSSRSEWRCKEICPKPENEQKEWRTLWFNVGDFISKHEKYLQLIATPEVVFDENDVPHCAPSAVPGVEVRIPNYGDIESLRTIDTFTKYLEFHVNDCHHLINGLIDAGWPAARLFGCPTDFRRCPCTFFQKEPLHDGTGREMNDLERLADLVETVFTRFQEPVLLCAHSEGSWLAHCVTLYKGQEWSQKYICGIFLAAPALAGTGICNHMTCGVGARFPFLLPGLTSRYASWPAHSLMMLTKELSPMEYIAYYDGHFYTTNETLALMRKFHSNDTAKHLIHIRSHLWRTLNTMHTGDSIDCGYVPPPLVPTHVLYFRGHPTRQFMDIRRLSGEDGTEGGEFNIALHFVDGDTILPFRPLRRLLMRWRRDLGPRAEVGTETEFVQGLEPLPAPQYDRNQGRIWVHSQMNYLDRQVAISAEQEYVEAAQAHQRVCSGQTCKKLLTSNCIPGITHQGVLLLKHKCLSVLVPEIVSFVDQLKAE